MQGQEALSVQRDIAIALGYRHIDEERAIVSNN